MTRNSIHLLGVPLDHGAGRRGVGMGPSAIRVAGVHEALQNLEREVVDLGDLVSFDIDVIDPRVAPGTGTPNLGGLTYREAHLAMAMIHDSNRLASLEMVEANPTLDDRNKTAELAVNLLSTALGRRIL